MKSTKSKKRTKKPWPTKAAMTQIYELNLWGKGTTDFYSGEGSHTAELVNPYVEVVRDFLTSFETPLTVCDLGCGDFNVGKQLVEFAKRYTAVDIVPDLIARNKNMFSAENLEFQCLDLATANLPTGDCALVRQVLQHLSNAEVESIARKLENYQYVILTEHLPQGDFIPNQDIISGQGIRLKKKSGIDLLAAPFYFRVIAATELLSVVPKDGKGLIVTTLYTIF
jgi:SAM-dependent methyltransferase